MKSQFYAIVDTGGEQLQVEPGRFYDIRNLVYLLHSSVDNLLDMPLLLYRILIIRQQSQTMIGQPWVKGAYIKGRILRVYKKRKIIVYKMRSKKKTRKKFGHRQLLNRFIVDNIYCNLNGG